MAIELHTFHVEGISSLLMHSTKGMTRKGGPVIKNTAIPTAEEEAELNAYRMENGFLYLPSIAFRLSLLRGCIGKKIGRTGAATPVAAGVFNAEVETPLVTPDKGKPIKDYKIDVRPVRIQKARVLRARPIILKWAADVVFEIDDDFVTVDLVRELFNIAGRIAGVGDYRPETRGPYGRYKVV